MKHPLPFLCLLLLLFNLTPAWSQENQVIAVSPYVGQTIDRGEKIKYGLFPEISTSRFEQAQYLILFNPALQAFDSTLVLRITFRGGQFADFPYTWEAFEAVQRQIEEGSAVKKEIDAAGQRREAKEDSILLQVLTHDGDSYNGYYEEKRGDTLFLASPYGILGIPLSRIREVKSTSPGKVVDGQYGFPNPNDTRYFFSPTAIPIGKGEGYYQNTYVLLNSVYVGVGDHLDIGGGIEILSTLSGNPIAYAATKLSGQVRDKWHLGGGVLVGTIFNGDFDVGFVGIAYGVSTFGSRENNVTLGMGWGFANEGWAEIPALNLGAMRRVSRRIALVSENYLIPGEVGVLSAGLRLMGEKVTFDFAFWRPTVGDLGILALPYIDFVYQF